MKARSTILAGLAWAFVLLTVTGAVLTLGALHGGGKVSIGPASYRLSAGYGREAQALLTGKPSQEALDRSESLTREAISLFPYDDGGWMRLAYIDSQRPDGLSTKGLAALDMSYRLFAADPSLAAWRVEFCLQNWSRLTPEIRESAHSEFLALAHSLGHRHLMDDRLKAITDPAGAIVAIFWFAELLRIRAENPAP